MNHYVTPIFSRQKLCKLNSSPTRVQAEQVKFSHLRGSFLAHFIKVKVYLWQVHIPMFCYVYRFLQPLADVIRTVLRTVELLECHWLACCFKTMTPETVGGFHSTKNSEIAGPKLNGTVKIPGLFECTLFDRISGIIENFVFHSQKMSGLVSLPSVGDRTIRFPVCHTPRNEIPKQTAPQMISRQEMILKLNRIFCAQGLFTALCSRKRWLCFGVSFLIRSVLFMSEVNRFTGSRDCICFLVCGSAVKWRFSYHVIIALVICQENTKEA